MENAPHKTAPKGLVILIRKLFPAPDIPLVNIANCWVTRVPPLPAVWRTAMIRDRRVRQLRHDLGEDFLVDLACREIPDTYTFISAHVQ